MTTKVSSVYLSIYLSISMEAWEVDKYWEVVLDFDYQVTCLVIAMEAWEVDKYRESVLDYQGTPTPTI